MAGDLLKPKWRDFLPLPEHQRGAESLPLAAGHQEGLLRLEERGAFEEVLLSYVESVHATEQTATRKLDARHLHRFCAR